MSASQSALPSSSRQGINTAYLFSIALAGALCGFLFGFDSAVINGAVAGLKASFNSSTLATGFDVGSVLLGCALGALGGGWLADTIGRKRTMVVVGLVFAITSVLSGLAQSSITFSLARFLSGLAVGAASVVAPLYLAEISPPAMRGRFASLQQMGIVVGIFIAFMSDWMIDRAAGGVSAQAFGGLEAWRWMFIVEVIPSALLIIAAVIVPESPRYLVATGRDAQALTIMRKIDATQNEGAIALIRSTVNAQTKPSLADLRGAAGGIRPIVWVGIGLAVLQQFVGINVIFYYGTSLWSAVGFTHQNAFEINLIGGLVNVIATVAAIALIDRVGRRPLLLWGSVGMALALAVVALMFGADGAGGDGSVKLSHWHGVIALVAANLYVVAFAISWGPIVWVLLGEMFNNRIRASALAVAATTNWLANWLVTVSFPPMLTGLGPAVTYGVYCAFAVISIYFVLRAVQETKGRALEHA